MTLDTSLNIIGDAYIEAIVTTTNHVDVPGGHKKLLPKIMNSKISLDQLYRLRETVITNIDLPLALPLTKR